MAEWWHVQIEWLGKPSADVALAATRALCDEDYNAPEVTVNGYDGRWREPVGACRSAATMAAMLDQFHPCRVRMAKDYYGMGDWDDMTAEEACERASWSYSRPLWRRECMTLRATRRGTLRIAADDGTTAEIDVEPGQTIEFLGHSLTAALVGKVT